MARYIDLDKCDQYRTNHGGYPDTFAFPPWAEFEDVTPVTHAHWIDTLFGWKCSNCEKEQEYTLFLKHCPNCGAKMDEVINDET